MTRVTVEEVSKFIADACAIPSAGEVNARVVFLNGPPGAGKDTAGALLRDALLAKTVKFAEPLKRAVYADAGLPSDLPLDFFEEVKEIPLMLFGGRSFRQACIDKSEKDLKPRYGEDYFGRLAARAVRAAASWGTELFAFTDSGFAIEALPVMRAVGPENCLLLRLHAAGRGKTFANDSRSHIELPVATADLHNDSEGDIQEFKEDLLFAVTEWISG